MEHGGKREGAGRKRGIGNHLTKELKAKINGPQVIKFLQDLTFGKIDGATISERKEAASILLKKILPDINRQETDLEELSPLQIVIAKSDANL